MYRNLQLVAVHSHSLEPHHRCPPHKNKTTLPLDKPSKSIDQYRATKNTVRKNGSGRISGLCVQKQCNCCVGSLATSVNTGVALPIDPHPPALQPWPPVVGHPKAGPFLNRTRFTGTLNSQSPVPVINVCFQQTFWQHIQCPGVGHCLFDLR